MPAKMKEANGTRARIEDVAEAAGVSIKTVSRVLNHEPNVRDETRRRVEEAVARLSAWRAGL